MEEIPKEIKQFIFLSFDSVDELRIFLLLRKRPDEDWSALQVSAALRLPTEKATSGLSQLQERGFLALKAGAERLYRCCPANPEIERMADVIVQLDQERPVTLINLIYSKPKDGLRAFSDAFKLKRGD